MAKLWDSLAPRAALAAIARDFHARGWMAGTAGNLSVRDETGDGFWVTASGYPKGQLEDDDFVRVAISDGRVVQSFKSHDRPSAEAGIHRVIYRRFPSARAALHVHTVPAVVATERHAADGATGFTLPPLEMIKGMGIWVENPHVTLPLFDNWLDVGRIAQDIDKRFGASPPEISALMIRRHGITVWGETLQQAYDRIEIMEFILDYLSRSPTSPNYPT